MEAVCPWTMVVNTRTYTSDKTVENKTHTGTSKMGKVTSDFRGLLQCPYPDCDIVLQCCKLLLVGGSLVREFSLY